MQKFLLNMKLLAFLIFASFAVSAADSYSQSTKFNLKLEDVTVPKFFPDHIIVKGDLLDYAVEIEWFDLHLHRMLLYLEEIGELENTIVIVTSDNGMPFPRAKANGYEYGVHVPLAVRFPQNFPGGRIVDDPISFADIAPTILELTQTSTEGMMPISGKSILKILKSKKQGVIDKNKKYVFSGRERHSASRYLNWGYPQRVIRSKDFLLIWNMESNRWPAGAPQRLWPGRPVTRHRGTTHRSGLRSYWRWALGFPRLLRPLLRLGVPLHLGHPPQEVVRLLLLLLGRGAGRLVHGGVDCGVRHLPEGGRPAQPLLRRVQLRLLP